MTPRTPKNVAVIGAGWSGCAGAVALTQAGHQVTVYEASHALGGRARGLPADTAGPLAGLPLDNGQHILIGAYSQTLRLMQTVGVDTHAALLRLPLALKYPDGSGLQLGHAPAPLDALLAVLAAQGWGWRDKASLLRASLGWQLRRFQCAPTASVAEVCAGLSPRVMAQLIEPLCVSALNTPAHEASAQVFLRVLKDSLFGGPGGSNLLLPRQDLSALFPQAVRLWLAAQTGHGQSIQTGQRVRRLQRAEGSSVGHGWCLHLQAAGGGPDTPSPLFDAVVLATAPWDAIRLLESLATGVHGQWLDLARQLRHEAITTVYAYAPHARLGHPMLALPSSASAPAQFVFDRGQLGGPPGLLAFVISASHGERGALQAQVRQQARDQLGLHNVEAIQTITEKRATFACTPGLARPPTAIGKGLWACGDYVQGPYPATLEGAVRSALEAASALGVSLSAA